MTTRTSDPAKNLHVVTGPPGSGKTPLVHRLAALGFRGVEEPARAVLAEQRAIDGDGVYDRDRRLFFQLMLERAVADHSRGHGRNTATFFDRGIPDLVGYAELFGLDASEAARAAALHRYADIVLALPSWPEIYVTDSERKMTVESAEAFGERVREVYVELGYKVVDVPRDTVAVRTAFVMDTLGLSSEVRIADSAG